MWWRFDLQRSLPGLFLRTPSDAEDSSRYELVQLHLDELIAMRDRRSRFGRNRVVEGTRSGDISSRKRGTGLELDSIGPYQWGDDVRHMDWFATARIGRPQIRQFRRDVQQTIILVIDLRPSMMFGSSEQLMAKTACMVAAKIAWSTSKNHQPLGLLLVTANSQAEFVPPRRGRRARLRCLARIVDAYENARFDASAPTPSLADGIEKLPSRMSGDVEAVIISDFSQLGDDIEQRLRESGARGVQSAVVIEDDLMRTPPPAGSYPLRSDRDRRLATVAIRKNEANLYLEEAEGHRRDLTARLMSLGMSQVLISDARSINEGYFR